MKYIISLIVLCSLSACTTHKAAVEYKSVVAVSGTIIPSRDVPEVREPEIVKAYPVGRYTDPNYPDEMHERHTLYRVEESFGWNYQPNAPYALPMGPTVANSDPSPGYYVELVR